MLKKLIPPVAAVLLLTLCAAVAAAHEHRNVHEYNFVVGFIQEPAFEGLLNAVSVRITRCLKPKATVTRCMESRKKMKRMTRMMKCP